MRRPGRKSDKNFPRDRPHIPIFHSPGHVARDRLHWLRQEYGNANDADKPRLAKQLLDGAEKAGDKAESVRWQAILKPKQSATKPAGKP